MDGGGAQQKQTDRGDVALDRAELEGRRESERRPFGATNWKLVLPTVSSALAFKIGLPAR